MAGAYEISCPDPQCEKEAIFQLDEIEKIVGKELTEKHKTFRLNTGKIQLDTFWGIISICILHRGGFGLQSSLVSQTGLQHHLPYLCQCYQPHQSPNPCPQCQLPQVRKGILFQLFRQLACWNDLPRVRKNAGQKPWGTWGRCRARYSIDDRRRYQTLSNVSSTYRERCRVRANDVQAL